MQFIFAIFHLPDFVAELCWDFAKLLGNRKLVDSGAGP